MKCKKDIMGFAAILILIFHFWMPLTLSPMEANLYKCAYLGVDIFIFVSAYSLSHKIQGSYLLYIENRLKNVYFPFVIMTLICALYKKWSLSQLALVICGAEFFKKGGGSFLWFVIAIMLLYLVAPFMVNLKKRLSYKALIILLAIWLVFVLLLQYVFHYTEIFILLNRIPIFVFGLYYEDIRLFIPQRFKPILIILGLILGGYIVFHFCGNTRISKPIVDIYYILLIPFAVSIIALFDYLTNAFAIKNPPLTFIGEITLCLYGFQMIFGYDLEKIIFSIFKTTPLSLTLQKLFTFFITAIVLILIAWVVNQLFKIVLQSGNKRRF